MATTIKFTKMQGTGNDYIYVNTLSSPLQDPIKAARKWSAYHTGIGADGLVLIGASEKRISVCVYSMQTAPKHDVWKRLALHRQICIRERIDG